MLVRSFSNELSHALGGFGLAVSWTARREPRLAVILFGVLGDGGRLGQASDVRVSDSY